MSNDFRAEIAYGASLFIYTPQGVETRLSAMLVKNKIDIQSAYIEGGLQQGYRYKQNLVARARGNSTPTVSTLTASASQQAAAPEKNVLGKVNHDQATLSLLLASSRDDLLQAMSNLAKQQPIWREVGIGLLVMFVVYLVLALGSVPAWLHLIVGALLLLAFIWVCNYDQIKNLTVLFYNVDSDTNKRIATLTKAIEELGRAEKFAAVLATGRYADRKYSAGEINKLDLASASTSVGNGPHIAANVEVGLINTATTTFGFYPDRILLFRNRAVGAVGYDKLQAEAEQIRYVERNGVPHGAKVVGKTWQYVNKDGGPDRRFKDNPQYPICEYTQLSLYSRDGLDVQFICSDKNAVDRLVNAINALNTRSQQAA